MKGAREPDRCDAEARIVRHAGVATPDHVVVIECPECLRRQVLSYSGWSGWVCVGCKLGLSRPRNGKERQ